MPEDRQFRQRLESWQRELKNHLMKPVAKVTFDGCTTYERLGIKKAADLPWQPMPTGTQWGRYREYCWFKANIELPEVCKGQRVVFTSGLEGEQVAYVNGVARGSIDKEHKYVTLFREAPENASVELMIESYAGHGARLENSAPCPPECKPIPDTPEFQCRIGESSICIFNEDAYQLYMDTETLIQLWRILPDGSVRRQQVEDALRAYIHIADFELDYEARNATFREARKALQPVLACTNGSSAPVLDIIGQSHIDLAWLWPLEETRHKVVRTFSNQLHLMEEYPEYRFLACEPILFDMLKESDPEVYDRLISAVKNGQMQPEGAFYVECDTNIPSGESLIRQIMWGKKWFRDNFDFDSKVAWHPDTFGFSPVLPQILKGMDVPYFSTQKLLRADPECERFPYQDFIWEGVDGTRVQANSFFNCNSKTEPKDLNERWQKHRTQKRDCDRLLYSFGYGDGGGGADRDTIEFLRREENLEGLPRTEWHTLQEHFELTREHAEKNVYSGELYLAWHRGTYSSQRKTKVLIRKLEEALRTAEMLVARCGKELQQKTADQFHQAWYVLLLNQFHDIAAGCGLKDVHREAEESMTAVLNDLKQLIAQLAKEAYNVQPEENTCTLLNTLSFARKEWVKLADGREGYVTLPPMGTKVIHDVEAPEACVCVIENENGLHIENGVIAFDLDNEGKIRHLTDLRSGLPVQDDNHVMNNFVLYKDVEPIYDAWQLSRDYVLDKTDDVHTMGFRVLRQDDVCFEAVVQKKIGKSECEEKITVHAGDSKILFETDIDWQERHKLLKVHFGTNMQCRNAIHHMQMCHIERPAHRSNTYEKDRYEVLNRYYTAMFEADRGAALMNKAIWGISAEYGDMALTLLHAPCVPDDTCDRGQQHFSYAFGVYDTSFTASTLTQDAYSYNNEPVCIEGCAEQTVGCWAENAIIETIKPAEDGEGIILRMYEHRGTRANVKLHLPEEYQVVNCGMQENGTEAIGAGKEFNLVMKPFEILTLRLVKQ